MYIYIYIYTYIYMYIYIYVYSQRIYLGWRVFEDWMLSDLPNRETLSAFNEVKMGKSFVCKRVLNSWYVSPTHTHTITQIKCASVCVCVCVCVCACACVYVFDLFLVLLYLQCRFHPMCLQLYASSTLFARRYRHVVVYA